MVARCSLASSTGLKGIEINWIRERGRGEEAHVLADGVRCCNWDWIDIGEEREKIVLGREDQHKCSVHNSIHYRSSACGEHDADKGETSEMGLSS